MGSGISQSTRAHQARVHYIVGHQVRHRTWWGIKLLLLLFFSDSGPALFNFFLLIIFIYLYNMLLFEANVCFFFLFTIVGQLS